MKELSTYWPLLTSKVEGRIENVTGMLQCEWGGLHFANTQRAYSRDQNPERSVGSWHKLNFSALFQAQPDDSSVVAGLALTWIWLPGSTSRSEPFRRKNNRRYFFGHGNVPVQVPLNRPQLP